MKIALRSMLLFAGMFLIATSVAEAQQRGGGGGMGMMNLLDPLEVALEHRAELELTSDQVSVIERHHAESVERTAEERKVVEPMLVQMRERMEAMERGQGVGMGQRGQMGERGQMGQRGEMRQRGQGDRMGPMNENVMGAMRTLRTEYDANMQALRVHLSDVQVVRLEELMSPPRPRNDR